MSSQPVTPLPAEPAEQPLPPVISALAAVRTVFRAHFDRHWLTQVIRDLPLDPWTIREIRELMALERLYPGDERHLIRGVRELERFVYALRRYLLPEISEKLGVSGFASRRVDREREHHVLLRFVAINFPHNVALLESLTVRLKAAVLLEYPLASTTTPWRSEETRNSSLSLPRATAP